MDYLVRVWLLQGRHYAACADLSREGYGMVSLHPAVFSRQQLLDRLMSNPDETKCDAFPLRFVEKGTLAS